MGDEKKIKIMAQNQEIKTTKFMHEHEEVCKELATLKDDVKEKYESFDVMIDAFITKNQEIASMQTQKLLDSSELLKASKGFGH